MTAAAGGLVLAVGESVRAQPPPPTLPAQTTLYRPFFTAGIAVALTVGASWGVWLLWQIGFARRFTGVSLRTR